MPTKLCGFSLSSVSVAALCASLLWLPADTAQAQSAKKDGIADLIGTSEKPAAPLSKAKPAAAPAEADPREGDLSYEQARQLMAAIDNILNDVSEQRAAAKKLPGKDEFLVTPLWTETKEDRETKVRALLDSALGIVTDVPVVEVQKKIEGFRRNIRELEERIVTLKEKQLSAPKDSMMPGVLTDTVASLGNDIEDAKRRIEENRANIVSAKGEIQTALAKAGLGLDADQLDLLIDSVLSGDLVRLAATFQAAKVIDAHLGKLMSGASENTGAARKYFAMHAALFALLVHAQDATIAKIDTQYMPKLDAILKDIAAAKARTTNLLRADNRPDQQRALEANRDSQKLAEEAARGYRRYLTQQREQIASARTRAAHDLRIADNTFETVEASLELRNLMRDSSASFEAIQKLEAPTFEQIFKNEELRREFENLTRKLDAPTS
jgi:polyhydroxyalkanoate synthesis regulator phasin